MRFGPRLLAAAVAVLFVHHAQAQVRDSASTWTMPGLNTPTNIHTEVTYDPITGFYVAQKYIGTVPIGGPQYFSPAEYQQMVFGQQEAKDGRVGGLRVAPLTNARARVLSPI